MLFLAKREVVLYKNEEINDIDGVKIDFPDKWVHSGEQYGTRLSGVYSEVVTLEAAEEPPADYEGD